MPTCRASPVIPNGNDLQRGQQRRHDQAQKACPADRLPCCRVKVRVASWMPSTVCIVGTAARPSVSAARVIASGSCHPAS